MKGDCEMAKKQQQKKPAAAAPPEGARAERILERSVCLTLHQHYLGNDRKVDVNAVVDEALDVPEGESNGHRKLDERAYGARKKLVDSKELRPVLRELDGAAADLRRLSIPTPNVFGKSSYLVPNGNVKEATARLKLRQGRVREEAAALATRWQEAVDRQKALLGRNFNERDYKTPAQVAAAFWLEWYWVSFAAPENLVTVDEAVAAEAEAAHMRRLASAYDEVVLNLRAAALHVVRCLLNRLKPGKDGKRKGLRDTALRDLQDFHARLPQLNLGDDAELEKVMGRLAKHAEGLDVDLLRDDEKAREALQGEAEKVEKALAGMVNTARRSINLGPLDV